MKNYINQLYSGKYIQCLNCGILIKQSRNNRQKYCPTCWKEKDREVKREWDRTKRRRKSEGEKIAVRVVE